MKKHSFLFMALLAAAVISLPFSTTLAAKTDKPNILVIWGDDIGVHNISAYNHGNALAAAVQPV